MNNELINSIIKNLTIATKDDILEWRLTNSSFNNDTSKRFEALSEDGLTRFQVILDIDNQQCALTSDLKLIFFNEGLVDGSKYANSDRYATINGLAQEIFDKYVKPNILVKNEANVLENILGSITSKQYVRDRKIDDILNTEKNPFLKKFWR